MKNKNNNLLTFILGIISYICLIPIIEELTNVLLSWIEYLKIRPGKLVIKGNNELKELQGEDDTESETCAIGFQYNPKEYMDDEDEEQQLLFYFLFNRTYHASR